MTELSMDDFTAAASDRVTADDLIGGPRVITITGVTGAVEEGKKRAIVNFEGDGGKPFKPCKTMARVMVGMWGKYPSKYIGRSLEIYCDPDVVFGGMATGGVRIKRASHIERDMVFLLSAKKGKKTSITVKPLQALASAKEAPAVKTEPSKAEAWTETHIAAIESAPDAMDLGILEQQAANLLAKLKAAHPNLLAKIDAAKAAKLASFGGDPSAETWRTNVLGAG
jgi:hypothetical protein